MANTLLFFDDQNLNILTNIKRVLIRPKLIGNPYSNDAEGLVSLAWGYPFVFFSDELKKYVVYYQGWSRDRSKIETVLTMAAVSDDGFNFKELEFTPFMPDLNRKVINQVLPYELNGGVVSEAQFFYLEKLNSEYKFLSLCLLKLPDGTNKAITFESLDGLRWQYKENAYWHDGDDAPDYPLSVYYNDTEQCYVLIKRPAHCDRRISLATTNDFINFSKQELIMQPDTLDVPLTDMYGMYGFNYKGNYLGLVMLYHTPNYLRFNDFKTSGLDTHKFYGGKVECQWSYSVNGKHYMRSFRDPIIGGGIDNFACAYPTSLLCRDKKIYIYSSLSKEEHGYITEGKSTIGCYEFREDGSLL